MYHRGGGSSCTSPCRRVFSSLAIQRMPCDLECVEDKQVSTVFGRFFLLFVCVFLFVCKMFFCRTSDAQLPRGKEFKTHEVLSPARP